MMSANEVGVIHNETIEWSVLKHIRYSSTVKIELKIQYKLK